jgi:hypothetical protein
MEAQLAANDGAKGTESWKQDDDADFFLKRIKEKRKELEDAVAQLEKARARRVPRNNMGTLQKDVLTLTADIGNYAMFIADFYDALPEYDDGKDDPALTDRDA